MAFSKFGKFSQASKLLPISGALYPTELGKAIWE
jgi:hypothetical protein